jgi:hypothetical protein
MVRFVLLALRLPQAREAGRGAEFPGFSLLTPGNVDGFEKTGFGFCLGVGD